MLTVLGGTGGYPEPGQACSGRSAGHAGAAEQDLQIPLDPDDVGVRGRSARGAEGVLGLRLPGLSQ